MTAVDGVLRRRYGPECTVSGIRSEIYRDIFGVDMVMNSGGIGNRRPAVPECQNASGKPACESTALAVCRDLIWLSTGKVLPERGLNQIS